MRYDVANNKTPFQEMSREDLELFAHRAYNIAIASRSILNILKAGDMMGTNPNYVPYWSEGSGGRALAKVSLLVRSVGWDTEDGDEKSYRQYYREATPALFKGATFPDGHPTEEPWWLCDACNRYTSRRLQFDPDPSPPTECYFCGAPVRELTLADVIVKDYP